MPLPSDDPYAAPAPLRIPAHLRIGLWRRFMMHMRKVPAETITKARDIAVANDVETSISALEAFHICGSNPVKIVSAMASLKSVPGMTLDHVSAYALCKRDLDGVVDDFARDPSLTPENYLFTVKQKAWADRGADRGQAPLL
jgi:hypothetical protein